MGIFNEVMDRMGRVPVVKVHPFVLASMESDPVSVMLQGESQLLLTQLLQANRNISNYQSQHCSTRACPTIRCQSHAETRNAIGTHPCLRRAHWRPSENVIGIGTFQYIERLKKISGLVSPLQHMLRAVGHVSNCSWSMFSLATSHVPLDSSGIGPR